MTSIQNYLAYSSISAQTTQTPQKALGDTGFDALLNATQSDPTATLASTKNAGNASSATDFLNSIQQFIANIDSSLFSIANSDSTDSASAANSPVPVDSTSGAFSADGKISVDALLNQGGPLPAFLDRVGVQYGLDDTQKQALRNIAIQFKDTDGSATDVQQISAALSGIGIG